MLKAFKESATIGQWKLSKQIFLCIAICNLYRSKQLATILPRLGHIDCPDFGLELETAMAKALDENAADLTHNITFISGLAMFCFTMNGTISLNL